MNNLIKHLWNDDLGAVIATEWLFVGTILIIGILPNIVLLQGVILNLLCCDSCVGGCTDPVVTCTAPPEPVDIDIEPCMTGP